VVIMVRLCPLHWPFLAVHQQNNGRL